jgi:hypothetical protein
MKKETREMPAKWVFLALRSKTGNKEEKTMTDRIDIFQAKKENVLAFLQSLKPDDFADLKSVSGIAAYDIGTGNAVDDLGLAAAAHIERHELPRTCRDSDEFMSAYGYHLREGAVFQIGAFLCAAPILDDSDGRASRCDDDHPDGYGEDSAWLVALDDLRALQDKTLFALVQAIEQRHRQGGIAK